MPGDVFVMYVGHHSAHGLLTVAIILGAVASAALALVALRRADLSTALRES